MKTYFISDAHLGSLAFPDSRDKELRLVTFLDSIKHEASAIYMLGDMFDFWHEWGEVVPKGYTRFLGKLSELHDIGVDLHYFIGNHDIWAYRYLSEECGVTLHRGPSTVRIGSLSLYLAHGDGLGDDSHAFNGTFIGGTSCAVFSITACCNGFFAPSYPWIGQCTSDVSGHVTAV